MRDAPTGAGSRVLTFGSAAAPGCRCGCSRRLGEAQPHCASGLSVGRWDWETDVLSIAGTIDSTCRQAMSGRSFRWLYPSTLLLIVLIDARLGSVAEYINAYELLRLSLGAERTTGAVTFVCGQHELGWFATPLAHGLWFSEGALLAYALRVLFRWAQTVGRRKSRPDKDHRGAASNSRGRTRPAGQHAVGAVAAAFDGAAFEGRRAVVDGRSVPGAAHPEQ